MNVYRCKLKKIVQSAESEYFHIGERRILAEKKYVHVKSLENQKGKEGS